MPQPPWETGLPAAQVLHAPVWPPEFPLGKDHLKRIDESADTGFYRTPRIVHHVDASAVSTLQRYYTEVLPRGGAILDLMSSWTSHLAPGAGESAVDRYFSRVSAVGLNGLELSKNPALHDYHVHDLNKTPALAMYEDGSFDAVICSVSVDYLAHPLAVFSEVARVLKPGGVAVFTWSNRMFPTKAIAAWRQASEPARLWICGSYFHYTPGRPFEAPRGEDLSPNPGRSDPVYAVSARKRAAAGSAAMSTGGPAGGEQTPTAEGACGAPVASGAAVATTSSSSDAAHPHDVS